MVRFINLKLTIISLNYVLDDLCNIQYLNDGLCHHYTYANF